MEEALEMLRKGRPADAEQTLAAALEAPIVSERDAALAEAEAIAERCRKERETLATNEWAAERPATAQASLEGKMSEAERIRDAIHARRSTPARRMLDAEVQRVLGRYVRDGYAEAARFIDRDLGLDLDAAPAKATPAQPDRPACDREDCCASVECPCACHEETSR